MRSWFSATLIVLAAIARVAAAAPSASAGATSPQARAGSDLFRNYCKVCHGEEGKGDGPLATSLKKRPADLSGLARRNNGTFPTEMVARIIDGRNPVQGHGGGDMPVWGDALLKAQESGTEALVKDRIMAIVDHLKTLQKDDRQH